jgi:WD40 repeat protein
VSSDCTARDWDVPETARTLVIPVQKHEVFSLNRDKYDPSFLATGSVDKLIYLWDVQLAGSMSEEREVGGRQPPSTSVDARPTTFPTAAVNDNRHICKSS